MKGCIIFASINIIGKQLNWMTQAEPRARIAKLRAKPFELQVKWSKTTKQSLLNEPMSELVESLVDSIYSYLRHWGLAEMWKITMN